MRTQLHEPLISVIMGVRYQREDLSMLERAIQSIQTQTYPSWELLICERGSTQAACDRLARFAKEDLRIRIIDGQETNGFSGQLNRCLAIAKGNWIARMDDDDFSHPGRLSTQMEYLQRSPQTAFVGCIAQLEREDKLVGMRQLPLSPTVRDFLFVQPFLHPTLLFRRSALETVGGYSEKDRCIGCEDYDLLLRLYERGFMGENIQKPLFIYNLPPLGSKKRTMDLRWNEVKTRYVNFRALKLLPWALPYVIKPVVVGVLPEGLLIRVKRKLGLGG